MSGYGSLGRAAIGPEVGAMDIVWCLTYESKFGRISNRPMLRVDFSINKELDECQLKKGEKEEGDVGAHDKHMMGALHASSYLIDNGQMTF